MPIAEKVKTGPDIAGLRGRQGGGVGEASTNTVCRLSDEQRAAVAGYAAKVAWPSGFVIYQRGAAADGVFVVSSGRVVLRSRVRAGRGFIPWIASCGETFGSEGLYPGGQYATDARSDIETETMFLSGAKFRAFVREQPQHAIAVFNQLMAERSMLLDKLRELTTLSVEQRIVAALSRLAHTDIFGSDGGQIILSPERYRLLCELVGATRESVSLVINRLTVEGLVERRGTTLVLAPLAKVMERSAATEGDPASTPLEQALS
jgi:CRP/FNR family cyclic AMP-dependent transcriptional regulator